MAEKRKRGRPRKERPAVEEEEHGEEKVFGEDGEELPETPAPAAPQQPEAEAAPVNFDASAEPEPEPEAREPRQERRGRPKGSTGKRKPDTKTEAGNITKILLTIHQIAAAVTDLPDLLLAESDASRLGEAIAEVQALYPATVLSPEVTAWGNLGLVGLMVYWPRIILIRRHLREQDAKRDIEVTPIRPNGAETSATTH